MSICIEKLTSVKEQKIQPHRIAHVTNSGSRSFAIHVCCVFLPCWFSWMQFSMFTSVSFFFSSIFISWRLITLQYCSGFCHTLT